VCLMLGTASAFQRLLRDNRTLSQTSALGYGLRASSNLLR
jgi:hypothetical protein